MFENFLHNKYLTFLAVVIFIILFYIDIVGWNKFIQGFLGIVIIYRFFEYYKMYFSNKTRVGRFFCNIGKHTLEIYLIHYFFVLDLANFAQYINLVIIQSSRILELIVFLLMSIIVVLFCLLFAKFVKISSLLHSFLFGYKK